MLSDTVRLIDAGAHSFKGLSESLPMSAVKASYFPKVFQVINLIGHKKLCAYVEYELISLSQLTSVGGNLNNTQVVFIAEELVRMYPNESVADFRVCFRMGARGDFGEIYRLDAGVIGLWMKQYIDVKYNEIENDLMKQKDNYYTPPEPETLPPKERPVDDERRDEWLEKWKKSLEGIETKRVSPLSDSELIKWGKKKPPQSKQHPATSFAEWQESQIHLEYIKANYDARTGKKLSAWVDEQTWRTKNNFNN